MEFIRKLLFVTLVTLVVSACGDMSSSNVGQAQQGSLASMVTSENRLHILNNGTIVTFDLSKRTLLQEKQVSLGPLADAETLFNYQGEHLLVGTDTGVIVYEIQQGEQLGVNYMSEFNHLRARDPVVAKDDVGFYTTRNGDAQFTSSADRVGVLDLSDITQPVLLSLNSELREPYGLAIFNDSLLVCDQALGLTQFEISKDEQGKVTELNVAKVFSNYPCNDIIVTEDKWVLTDETGIFQVRFFEGELELLSYLPIF